MQVQALSCNNCGAPLEVPPTTAFATCGHCGSRLAIKRTENAAYTEVLGNISQNTETISRHTGQMSNDLAAIRLQNELDRLERDWAARLQTYRAAKTITLQSARRNLRNLQIVVGFAATLFTAAFLILLASSSATGSCLVMGLFVVGLPALGLLAATKRLRQAEAFDAEVTAYVSRRHQLYSRLQGL
jgi:DNA-directed RNA polymerase subunit RPC12/RpoP